MPTSSPSLVLNGADVALDPSGALVWPARRAVVVADLHLEKGSSFACRGGAVLPPYDSAATLTRLAAVLARHRPDTVICLGDSFHDAGGPARLPPDVAARLRDLTAAHDWVWIAGNHDPAAPEGLGGRALDSLSLGPLTFRHEANSENAAVPGEVSGHYHPKATVRVRGRRIQAPCFLADSRRAILPAFGAYTGGLSVLAPALRRLVGTEARAHLLARDSVHTYPLARLVAR